MILAVTVGYCQLKCCAVYFLYFHYWLFKSFHVSCLFQMKAESEMLELIGQLIRQTFRKI